VATTDRKDKTMSMKAAVVAFVHAGGTVCLEGFTHLVPTAAGHEIIRRGRRDLTVGRMTADSRWTR
jgi:glutaconate CoA-transferase subunit A